MARTIRIRIPVAVDPQGRWYAYGYPGLKDHNELLETTDFDQIGPNEALYWVTAEVAIPEIVETAGEVEEVK
jgi:hypothetical protein